MRHTLKQKFGDLIDEKGSLPAHLLGNMWAQSWEGIYKYTAPYPNKKSTDVTDEMIHQDYTPLKMFKLGEKFYESLNMSSLPQYVLLAYILFFFLIIIWKKCHKTN